MNLTRRKFVGFQLFFIAGLFSKRARSRLSFMIDPERDREFLSQYLRTLIPRRSPDVSCVEREEGPLLRCPGLFRDHTLVMNESARVIWERCDGKTNVEEIVQEVMKRFEVDEKTCIVDTFSHLARLKKCGMITLDMQKV